MRLLQAKSMDDDAVSKIPYEGGAVGKSLSLGRHALQISDRELPSSVVDDDDARVDTRHRGSVSRRRVGRSQQIGNDFELDLRRVRLDERIAYRRYTLLLFSGKDLSPQQILRLGYRKWHLVQYLENRIVSRALVCEGHGFGELPHLEAKDLFSNLLRGGVLGQVLEVVSTLVPGLFVDRALSRQIGEVSSLFQLRQYPERLLTSRQHDSGEPERPIALRLSVLLQYLLLGDDDLGVDLALSVEDEHSLLSKARDRRIEPGLFVDSHRSGLLQQDGLVDETLEQQTVRRNAGLLSLVDLRQAGAKRLQVAQRDFRRPHLGDHRVALRRGTCRYGKSVQYGDQGEQQAASHYRPAIAERKIRPEVSVSRPPSTTSSDRRSMRLPSCVVR